jgi:hypothetical protein
MIGVDDMFARLPSATQSSSIVAGLRTGVRSGMVRTGPVLLTVPTRLTAPLRDHMLLVGEGIRASTDPA